MTGQQLYEEQCMRCHGSQGQGSPLVPYALSERKSFKNQEIFVEFVKTSKDAASLDSFLKGLSDEDLGNIYRYLVRLRES